MMLGYESDDCAHQRVGIRGTGEESSIVGEGKNVALKGDAEAFQGSERMNR